MNKEILNIIKERGLLLEKDVFDLLKELNDDVAKEFLNYLGANHKIITMSSLSKNFSHLQEALREFPGETQNIVEKTFINFGINLEIKKELHIEEKKEGEKKEGREQKEEGKREAGKKENYRIFYANTGNEKKIGVKDFVGHFRARYRELQAMLMKRAGMDNLTAINKISSNRQNYTLIGMVIEKRTTKNRNLIIKTEDLTGETNVLVKHGSKCYKDADELQLDDVVAFKCSGNNEILFAREIVYPDGIIETKTKFDEEACLMFISDIHVGSNKFLYEEFENFVKWLDSNDELAKKVKYIFIVGDAVDGVGVFPGQERLLTLKTLKAQYDGFAEFVKRIPKRITMFMCPGQHDASRVPEPQPIVDRKYAGSLYGIENLVLVSNPCMVKLLEGEKEFKVLMYHGASIHNFINNIEELRTIKAHKYPAKAVKHMLKRRHLAPSHGVSASIVYVPNIEKDPLVITEVPDILCTGEVHRLDIEKYNGTLILTGSCWQARTEFEEKVGNIPDPCKIPVFNLKTHELRILDFSNENSVFREAR